MKIGNEELNTKLDGKDRYFSVTLLPSQYTVKDRQVVESALVESASYLPGVVDQLDDQGLKITYQLPVGGQSLLTALNQQGVVDRFRFAYQALALGDAFGGEILPVLDPENIFVQAGQIRLAHRGIKGLWAPLSEDVVDQFQDLKALIAVIANPKLKFAELKTTAFAARDAFTRDVLSATTREQLNEVVARQAQTVITQAANTQQSVNRKTYQIFKWGFFSLAVVTLVSLAVVGYEAAVNVPYKDRLVTTQAAYMTQDYDKATSTLAQDKAADLPKSVQYVLAASYVNLDNLTQKQKQAILNHLSASSAQNELLYWIALGRGNLEDALSLAKNLGDNQLILHAYAKLYDATENNTKMSGDKKQKLLADYKKQIDDYTEKLGGVQDGVTE
jgi:type VII secretion protein EssB